MEKFRKEESLLTATELEESIMLEQELELCKETKTLHYGIYVRYMHLVARHNGFSSYQEMLEWKNGEEKRENIQ